jgi:hypothetical protein
MVRLVEDRQVEAGEVDQLGREGAVGVGDVVEPRAELRTDPGRVLVMIVWSLRLIGVSWAAPRGASAIRNSWLLFVTEDSLVTYVASRKKAQRGKQGTWM